MKNRTTQKAIRNGYAKVIYVGYCNLQNLLRFESPVAYTTRREGWGADIYDFGNVAIATGYAPFGNVKPGYDIQKEYDDKASKIRSDYSLSYEVKKQKIRELLKQFIYDTTEYEIEF